MLKNRIEELIPTTGAQVKTLLKNHGSQKVDNVNLNNVILGIQELPVIFSMGAYMNENQGIQYRGYSLTEMQQKLSPNNQPSAEALLWLLMTGEMPNNQQVEDLRKSLVQDQEHQELPKNTRNLIQSHAKTHDPTTVLSLAILELQKNSQFFNVYGQGNLKKSDFWIHSYEDAIQILRQLPKIVSMIYTERYEKRSSQINQEQDWVTMFANLLGFQEQHMIDVLKAVIFVNAAENGGNLANHSAIIASSALCDNYLSYVNSVNGMSAPQEGQESQQYLNFLNQIEINLTQQGLSLENMNTHQVQDSIKTFVQNWCEKQVVPGFGHSKLTVQDTRYTYLLSIAQKTLKNNHRFQLAQCTNKIVSEILQQKNARNCYPNVMAMNGLLLQESGMKELDFHPVLFSLSRALGVFTDTVWARAMMMPLERPGSMTLEQVREFLKTVQFIYI